MKFPRIAKVIGFTEAEFETQDGAIAFSIEHTEAIEAKLNDHSVKKEEWKTERASLESTHQAALEAEQKKTAEATEALGKMTLELAEAKEKIQSLEDEPADKSEVRNNGGGAGADDEKYSFSSQRFRNVGKRKGL